MVLWQVINAAGFFYEVYARTGYQSNPDLAEYDSAGKKSKKQNFDLMGTRSPIRVLCSPQHRNQ